MFTVNEIAKIANEIVIQSNDNVPDAFKLTERELLIIQVAFNRLVRALSAKEALDAKSS